MAGRQERLAELAELEGDDQRRSFLEGHPELIDPAVVTELCDGVVAQLRVDLDRAERLARAARLLAEELGDDYCRGRSLRAAAIVLTLRSDNPSAFQRLAAALECFERIGDESEAAITRSSAVQCLIHSSQYERALEWASAARESFQRLGDRLRLARLELNVGSLLARRDRFDDALIHFRSAYEDFLHAGQPRDIGTALRNLAVCYQFLNDFQAALDAYRRARAYCEQNDLPLFVLEIDYNIAYLHYLRGEYDRALRLFEISRRNCERLEDHQHMALCDLDRAEIYLELNLVVEAGRLARRGRDEFERLGMQYEMAKCLIYLAMARSRQGKDEEAMAHLDEARELFVGEQNRAWPAMIDLYRSRILYVQGRFGHASRLASDALAAFGRSSLPSRVALCEIHLACLELAAGSSEQALRHCAAALERLQPFQLPALEHQAWVVSGRAKEALGDRPAAMVAYRQADATVERLRSHLQTDELRISFLEDKLEVYESLVWLGLEDGGDDDDRRAAFADIERAKSRGLTDLLAFRAGAIPAKSAADSELVERLRSLRQELNGLYRQIDLKQTETGERSRGRVEELRQACHGREAELIRVLRALEVTDREFSSLQEGTTIDLESVRSFLDEGTVLLEYYFARDTVFACVLRQDGLEIVPVSSPSRVRELHRALQYQLSKLLLGRDYADRFQTVLLRDVQTHLRALYDELIAPLRPHLDARYLVVVPHDVLHYVPFHALHEGDRYLIDSFTISYAPSASVYYLCRARLRTPGDGATLVMGAADERAPLIRREAEAVAAALPGARLLLGEEASEENLRRYGRNCRIVHLAAHGYFRRDNAMFSSIQLGSGRLSVFDLYDLQLDAELAVLSGCGTGLAEVQGGDELVGLSRGLLYAGARSLALTLWDVNDESTTELMRSFYHHLTAGRGPARALSSAMRELRESHPHPYYWAPFVLIGNPGGGLGHEI